MKNEIQFRELFNASRNEILELWSILRDGLRERNGIVRINAFYAFDYFRSWLHLIRDPRLCGELNLRVMRELYSMAKNEKDRKIRMNLLRCLATMECVATEGIAYHNNALDEYFEIMEWVEKETGGKYRKCKSETQMLIEELGRRFIYHQQEIVEALKKIMEENIQKERRKTGK